MRRKLAEHEAAEEAEKEAAAARAKAARVAAARKKLPPRITSPVAPEKDHQLDVEDAEEGLFTLEYSNALEKLIHNPGKLCSASKALVATHVISRAAHLQDFELST